MPLLWLSLAFLAGIAIAASLPLTAAAWWILAGSALGGVLLAILGRSVIRKTYSVTPSPSRLTNYVLRFTDHVLRFTGLASPIPLCLVPLLLALGGLRYQLAQPDLHDPVFIAFYNDQETYFVIEGILVEPPDERDTYTNLRVAVKELHTEDEVLSHPVSGLLLAKVQPGSEWRYGDRVFLEGTLETPPENEDFSYRDYLAREGVYSLMPRARGSVLKHDQGNPVMAVIYAIKTRALAVIYRIYPDPEASLMAGILLGVETGIPESVQAAFKATGTSHLIAISGFNVAIIAGLFSTLFSKLLGPRRGAVAAVAGIAFYTVLVGADASVVRAAIMGGLSLLARQIGRRQAGVNSLAAVAAVMALANPRIPWDVGFQLSFAATLGLILYADPLAKWFQNLAARYLPPSTVQRIAGPVGEYFLFTLAAQFLTLPIMAYHFGRLSLVSFIANPVVLPVQPPIMILGGLAVILGMIYAPLGQIASYLAWPFVLFTIRAVELFATIPAGTLALGDVALPLIILIYAVIFSLTVWGQRARGLLSALGTGIPLAALSVGAFLIWRAAFFAPDGKLTVTVLDVGTGDAILIQTPTGRNLLIDGGPTPTLLSDALGRRLPFTNRRLDWLVVAASGDEQIAALPRTLDRFPPNAVLWAGPTHLTRSVRDLQETFAAMPVTVRGVETGQLFDLGGGAGLKVLSAGRRGAILLLEYGGFRMALPIGADFESLESLENGDLIGPVTALLLADSGYAASNPPEWVANLQPQIILLSVAAGDRKGLPDAETLDAVAGYPLLRTDLNGWIRLSTDGENLWVSVERSQTIDE